MFLTLNCTDGIERGTGVLGKDFRGECFQNKDFIDLSMRWTNCEGVNFEGSHFDRCSMEGANFRRVNFSNANLHNCCFSNTCLMGADFTGAGIIGNKFRHAILKGVVFDKVKNNGRNGLYDLDFRGADLRGASFKGLFLTASVDFRFANLEGADFSDIKVQTGGLDFKGANLKGANFDGALIKGETITRIITEQDTPFKLNENKFNEDSPGVVNEYIL